MHETVLVTGVKGFLGQYIVREFVARKSRVAAVSRSPILETAPWTNSISDLLVSDLCSPQFEAMLVAVKPDLIIHAAGPSSVAESVKDPTSDFLGSVDVFYHVMDSVRRLAPSCKVLLLSSAAVYGNPQTLPVHEDAPLCPISPYGFHKKISENIIEEFHSVYGIRGCSVRIFSAYGAGLKRQVLWDISRKALWDKVVNLQGTGEETRDFVHAEDVARGLGIVADHAAFSAEAYNLSCGVATTIREVAETLVAELGRNCTIDFSQVRRDGDPLFWQADITRLSQLGYEPRISFVRGAAEYAKWVLEDVASCECEIN